MDKLSPKERSENMRRIKSKGMRPELIVRRMIYRLGYRYRLHNSKLPGRPDIVIPRLRKIVMVHGCFWHQHPKKSCVDSRFPRSNRSYWLPKLRGNMKRDLKNLRQLRAMGWRVLTVWECDVCKLPALEQRLTKFLRD